MKHKLSVILMSAVLILCLTACSDAGTEEIAAYRTSMEAFFERYEAYNEALASVDPAAPASSAQLTASIDKMLIDAEELAAAPVPEAFESVSVHIDDYTAHVRSAADALHRAFDQEVFDAAAYGEAIPELEAAGSAIRDIITVLRSPAE